MIFQQKNLTRFWQIWRDTAIFKFLLQKCLTKAKFTRVGLETESENLIRERKGEREKARNGKEREKERESIWLDRERENVNEREK